MARRERGLALLSVLWVTALLATLAAGFTADTRTESRLARNQLLNAQAEALADAGVHRGVLWLYGRDLDAAWERSAARYSFRLARGRIRVEIIDEDAKVDLNGAPAPLLEGLIRAIGVEPEAATTLAARIVDYRDPDQEPEASGAEDGDYDALGLDHEAKDAPFTMLNELLLVAGMSAEVYERLRPHVTVHTGSAGVDPQRASPTVLAAIPGMTPEMVETLLALDPDEDPYEAIDEAALYDLEEYFTFSNDIMFTIRAEAESEGGGVFVREAVIEAAGDQDEPFAIHSWRQALPAPAGPDDGDPSGSPGVMLE